MELSENSPLEEWNDRSKGLGDDTYIWVNESEDYKIELSRRIEQWDILLYHNKSLYLKVYDECVRNKILARAIAEEFAKNPEHFEELD